MAASDGDLPCKVNILNEVLLCCSTTDHSQKQYSEFPNFALNFLCLLAKVLVVPCNLTFLKLVILRKINSYSPFSHSVSSSLPHYFFLFPVSASVLSLLSRFSHTKGSQNPQGFSSRWRKDLAQFRLC